MTYTSQGLLMIFPGVSMLIPTRRLESMSLIALSRHVGELREFYDVDA